MTADEQTAGRGRQGREWIAPPGSAVLMSVVLRELDETSAADRRRGGLRGAPRWTRRIKWPNDVWIDGRKVAGILVEGRPQEGWAVLGVGLNVAQLEFPAELRGVRHVVAARGRGRRHRVRAGGCSRARLSNGAARLVRVLTRGVSGMH